MSEHQHDHPDIGCLEAIEGLYELLDGELTDQEKVDQIEAHVAHCKSCYSRAEIERLITKKIKSLHSQGESSESAPRQLRQRLRSLIDDL